MQLSDQWNCIDAVAIAVVGVKRIIAIGEVHAPITDLHSGH